MHSPLSILNNQYPKLSGGNPDWELFIRKLASLDMAVVGITDYFTIEGYKVLKKFKEEGRLPNIQTILPNIEFRLKNIIISRKSGEERRLNLHVIFSDEVSTADIDDHFLHDISFYFQGDPQNKDEKRKLKSSNLAALGKELIAQHASFANSGFSDLEIGAMQAVVDHEEITEILTGDSRFKDKYLIVLDAVGWDQYDWDGQAHVVRKGLLQKSDMVFSSNSNTRDWCLGRKPYMEGEKKFIQEFKTLKPCIHGSDSHKIDEIGHPCALRGEKDHRCAEREKCNLRYCWIKADPTFEGLKQLLYEPTERIALQEIDPSPVKSNYTIGNVKFTDCKISDDLSITKTDIELNSNLVAVTGSKGSGKTALVDLIANCYIDRCHTDDNNSFVRRIFDQDPIIETGLVFRNGKKFKKGLGDGAFFDDSKIIYIAQGELEKYIGSESDLDAYVRNLVFESPQIKDGVKSFEFTDLSEKLGSIEAKISAVNGTIEGLEKKTGPKELQAIQLELKQKQAELSDVEKRIKELAQTQSEDNIKLVQRKQEKLAELKTKRDDLISLRNLLQSILGFIDRELPEFNRNITAINASLKKLGIPEKYSDLSYSERPAMGKRLDSVKADIINVVSNIEASQKDYEKFEASLQDHAKLLDRKRDVGVAIDVAKAKGTEAEKNKLLLEQLIKERQGFFKELIETVVLSSKKYDEIIEVFSAHKIDILSDLDFHAQINFDSVRFLKAAEDFVDNRKIPVIGSEGIRGAFDNFISLSREIANGNEAKISELVEEAGKLSHDLKSKLKGSRAVSTGNFYDFLYGNHMSVAPVIRYKKTNLNKLSLGQKATVLIKIYLAQDDRPIIIDSHDDHLDNEFIMLELVNAIREAKRYRQVILVSNNGNVVINSDAEQIIVANRNNGGISYVSGSIENPDIRDLSLKVLEGGSEAFKKRQQKYRLGY